MHEGIATYYGGGSQKKYTYHINVLREYLSKNNVDFSGYEKWRYTTIANYTYIENTIGAMIIDYTLRNYGKDKVVELFECEDYEAVFNAIRVSKDEINEFILNEIQNYERNLQPI